MLIRWRRIKAVRFTAAQLNQLIMASLPQNVKFDVPGGTARLVVMTAELTLGKDNHEGLSIELMCSLEIGSLGQQLYRAHLQGTIRAQPYYHQAGQSIRLKDEQITRLQLVNDEYLLIKSATGLVKSLTPNLLQGLMSATLGSAVDSAMGMVSALTIPGIKGYLTMFTDGNKQKVLDFHRGQVEQTLKQLIGQGDLEYALEQSDLEEKIFADMGRTITIEDHQLVFHF